jgi:hypothetical protein
VCGSSECNPTALLKQSAHNLIYLKENLVVTPKDDKAELQAVAADKGDVMSLA